MEKLPQEINDAIEGLVVKTQSYYWSNPNPGAGEIRDEKAALVAAIAKAIAEDPAPGVRTALNECIEGARLLA